MTDLSAALEEIRGTWDRDDPRVLAFADEYETVVADVDGELRALSGGLVYARRTTTEKVAVHAELEGEPQIAHLSEFSHRFDREDFEELHPHRTEEAGRDA